MKINIMDQGLNLNQEVKEYMEQKLQDIFFDLDTVQDLKIDCMVKIYSPRKYFKQPQFMTRINIYIPYLKKTLSTKTVDSSFYNGMRKTIEHMHSLVMKNLTKKRHEKRRVPFFKRRQFNESLLMSDQVVS